MSVSAFPLQWPVNRPRRPNAQRKTATFGKKVDNGTRKRTDPLTIYDAVKRLQNELDMIGARYPTISTNVETRLDGLPRSDRAAPEDPGVALYFTLGDKPHCMPCDTYTRVADNMAAIAAHMAATRLIERHGVASVAEMFAGFQALPAPGKADSQQWFNVLGFDARAALTEIDIRERYRRLAKERADSEPALRELNVARDEALKAVRS